MRCTRMALDIIHCLEVLTVFCLISVKYPLHVEPMLHVVLTSIGLAVGYPLHLVEEKFHKEQIKRFEEQAALYAGREDQ